jgi:hypothetical protein
MVTAPELRPGCAHSLVARASIWSAVAGVAASAGWCPGSGMVELGLKTSTSCGKRRRSAADVPVGNPRENSQVASYFLGALGRRRQPAHLSAIPTPSGLLDFAPADPPRGVTVMRALCHGPRRKRVRLCANGFMAHTPKAVYILDRSRSIGAMINMRWVRDSQ